MLEGYLVCYVGAEIQTLVLMMAQLFLPLSHFSSSLPNVYILSCYYY